MKTPTEQLQENNLPCYKRPTLDLLAEMPCNGTWVDSNELECNKARISHALITLGIEFTLIEVTVGPVISLYEVTPTRKINLDVVRNIEDDIINAIGRHGVRIVSPMPGKNTIGIEIPNDNPQPVSLRSIVASSEFQESKYELPVALGKTITNEVFIADLAKMPHVLVAGATGQCKLIGLNAIITSLLYKKHPAELKFVLIDPKKVELSIYSSIERHFLAKLPDTDEPFTTDPSQAVKTLNAVVREMEIRYDLLKQAKARNFKDYNAKYQSGTLLPEKGHRSLPYIVVVIDELSDLIMTAGKEVESPIIRIAQLARAVGIHMIIATQRPSTNVITGIIKANFPARIAFRVQSMIDSRTILDCPGANRLIGRGDMLISQGGEMVRVQCAFVDTPEVEEVCRFISEQPICPHTTTLPEPSAQANEDTTSLNKDDLDPLFEEAARIIVSSQQASTSSLQRRYSIGYNRAGRLMDQLQATGIVGPLVKVEQAREVLIKDMLELEEILQKINESDNFIDTADDEYDEEFISQLESESEEVTLPDFEAEEGEDDGVSLDVKDRDPLFEEAARSIVLMQQASTSSLQRRYSIGYNRAGRLMDQLEAAGIVGPAVGGRPREVLIMDVMQLENKLEQMK